ncbi:hypothetical protein [Glutamicibacter sp.]|uniref:hypothetical protein n=1 Tax=Glutamicibacter sp. TaxID=1931995 RepID=UPI003D6B8968
MADSIVLDGVTLNKNSREGAWKVTGIEGWWDSAKAQAADVERPNNDGSMPGVITYEPRQIRISGRVIAKSHNYIHEAMQMLAALSFRSFSNLTVAGHGATQTASVRIDGNVSFNIRSDKYLQFEIPLIALDPFKYGERRYKSVAAGASDTVFHRGTVEAWPSVTVLGSMPDGYTVSIGGQSVSVPMGIPSGVTHTIDYRRRRLYINGELFMGAFGSQKFRSIPPGLRTNVSLSAPSGSGSAGVTVYDTYI